MPLVAVCGIPGSGKSTVSARLKALGLDAWDTDVDGIAAWRDQESKLPVPAPDDWSVDGHGIEYCVSRDRVEELRRRAGDHIVYLCGPAGGEDEYWDLLDLVIQLEVDNDTLRHRLTTRTNNPHGKASGQLERILASNVGWAAGYRSRGAIIVDSTKPLDDVVADIISAAELHCSAT